MGHSRLLKDKLRTLNSKFSTINEVVAVLSYKTRSSSQIIAKANKTKHYWLGKWMTYFVARKADSLQSHYMIKIGGSDQ